MVFQPSTQMDLGFIHPPFWTAYIRKHRRENKEVLPQTLLCTVPLQSDRDKSIDARKIERWKGEKKCCIMRGNIVSFLINIAIKSIFIAELHIKISRGAIQRPKPDKLHSFSKYRDWHRLTKNQSTLISKLIRPKYTAKQAMNFIY